MKPAPKHAPMDQFATRDGQLLINQQPIRQLALRVGQTPFYAYDRNLIAERVTSLRSQLPQQVHIHYAIKSNPMPALVDFISHHVDGLDVASGKELITALDSSIPANHISFAGPAKSHKELQMALASGCTINLESETELERVIELSKQHQLPANVAVRVNPDFELKASGMKMGGGAQQFGIDAERVPDVIARIKTAQLNFMGLHIFTGSQNLKAEALINAHDNIFRLAQSLKEKSQIEFTRLNIGGGFGIPYFPGESPLDLAPVIDNLKQLLAQYQADFANTEIVLELGRYLVGEAGIYVCEVTDIKESRGEKFLIVNGGLNHHLSASGNFGQVIRKNYPTAIGNKMNATDHEVVNVVGPLCTPLDLLANKMSLPVAEIGDLVVIYQSGAYGYTASPKDFLSHGYPLEVLV
ncbi:pyridoxal-dependent decarboxylase, exosortase A system-associated [Pleionea sp. CnH1-48]|uniref:pyridoxal-dependent decarboxylase, exosortase A system-associated n=1 Tax=Pleionea sp. CnH1-48 TaxID=2954494 RepID=UPI0020973BB0|nr:pyridoxal-dependent decarboxylase, exosortase A system-associated [Pleionea sp. CnH1-48]MCO7224528.1 pyridoxal-dependent decarboxylase, exosortase A system-associated [Pleionea sp. CnH1-48]